MIITSETPLCKASVLRGSESLLPSYPPSHCQNWTELNRQGGTPCTINRIQLKCILVVFQTQIQTATTTPSSEPGPLYVFLSFRRIRSGAHLAGPYHVFYAGRSLDYAQYDWTMVHAPSPLHLPACGGPAWKKECIHVKFSDNDIPCDDPPVTPVSCKSSSMCLESPRW